MEASPIVYIEIPAPNFEKATDFYESIFNWQIKESNLSNAKYAEFHSGDNSLHGGLDSSTAVHNGGIIFYIKVKDIESTLKKIKTFGGAILKEKFNIGGGHGYSAIFKDPNGNHIGLFSTD